MEKADKSCKFSSEKTDKAMLNRKLDDFLDTFYQAEVSISEYVLNIGDILGHQQPSGVVGVPLYD